MDLTNEEKNQKTDMDKQVRISIYLIMALFSVSITMISPLMPVIVEEFAISRSQGGLIMTFQSLGGMLITVLMIFIADKYSKALLIMGGFFLVVISLFAISVVSVYNIILFLFFIYGIGSRVADNLNNSYLADRFPQKRGVYLNILHGVFGLGALAGPLLAGFLVSRDIYWGMVFRLVGFLSLVVLLYFIVVIMKDKKTTFSSVKKKQTINFLKIFKNFHAWVLLLMMFLYVGNQVSLSTWLPMYMEEYLETSSMIASLSLSLFWIGIISSRFLASLLTLKFSNLFLLTWGNLIGGIILLAGLFSQLYWLFLVAIVLIGFSTGASFPLIVDSASKLFPENTGTITSVVFIIVNLATMFFPWFIGLLSDIFNFQIAFLAATMVLFLIPLASLLVRGKQLKES